jgi:putative transposase
MVHEHGETLGVAQVSAALGVPRSSAYRWQHPAASRREREGAMVVRQPSPRALSQAAQDQVLAYLRDPRFVDRAPAQVHATLLDEGTYVCSVRTLYRRLASAHEVRARRGQRTHPRYPVPRLVATQPNQVWTWDVTDLKGPVKNERYKLYVVLDLFSRFVVAWMLARRESAMLAQRLIRTACERQGIGRDQLTTHSDRGSIQVAKDLHDLYQDLGILRSLSRPRVSNDNPYSESFFKTAKYAPTYPDRFDDYAHAKAWCGPFFQHYNHEHKHEGLAWLTPATVHDGLASSILAQRQRTMDLAYQQHPERFVNGPPRVPQLPAEVWINKAEDQTAYLGETR